MFESEKHAAKLDKHSFLYTSSLSNEEVVKLFLKNQINIDASAIVEDISLDETTIIARKIINALLSISLELYPTLLDKSIEDKVFCASDIPQFSNMETAMYYIPKLLFEERSVFTYSEIGNLIHNCKSEVASKKYGENHAKLTVMMGLACFTKKEGRSAIKDSIITSEFCRLDQNKKIDILQRLCYRIPLIQSAIVSENWRKTLDDKLSVVSESTRHRRLGNCISLISFALGI